MSRSMECDDFSDDASVDCKYGDEVEHELLKPDRSFTPSTASSRSDLSSHHQRLALRRNCGGKIGCGTAGGALGCGPALRGARRGHPYRIREVMDTYCTKSYASHAMLTTIDSYHKEMFRYQRKIDTVQLLKELCVSVEEVGKDQDLESLHETFVEKLLIKKAQALESAIERGKHYSVGRIDPESGLLRICPDKRKWMTCLQQTLDEEYIQACEEARSILQTWVDKIMTKKNLLTMLTRELTFWEKELSSLFSVWQDSTSQFLDLTYARSVAFEELFDLVRTMESNPGYQEERDAISSTFGRFLRKGVLSKHKKQGAYFQLMSEIVGRLLYLDFWQLAHEIRQEQRVELIKLLNTRVSDKSMIGSVLFNHDGIQTLASCRAILLSSKSSLPPIVIESANAYWLSLIRAKKAPPPIIDKFPGLLRASCRCLLVVAVEMGLISWVNDLLQNGASPLEPSAQGTPIAQAQRLKRHDIMAILRTHLSITDIPSQQVINACFRSDVEEVRNLIPTIAGEISCTTVEGWTPLHVSAYVGSIELVELLIPMCDVNALDDEGHTALLIAVENRRKDIVLALLEAGANDEGDVEGVMPAYEFARSNEDHEMLVLLRQHSPMARLSMDNDNSQSSSNSTTSSFCYSRMHHKQTTTQGEVDASTVCTSTEALPTDPMNDDDFPHRSERGTHQNAFKE